MKSEELATAMKREIFEKWVLTAVMVGWFVWMPVVGYKSCYDIATYGTILAHFLYIWSHANIWHLLGNLFVLWIWRGRLHAVPSLLMAILCSWLPTMPGVWEMFSAEEPLNTVTVGFSGVLFAMAGIKWGIYCRRMSFTKLVYGEFFVKAIPFALLGILIPHINWCIHLYCMLAGFAYGGYYLRR